MIKTTTTMELALPVLEEQADFTGLLPGRINLDTFFFNTSHQKGSPFFPITRVDGYALHHRLIVIPSFSKELGLSAVQRLRTIHNYLDQTQPTAMPIIPISEVIAELNLDRSDYNLSHLSFSEEGEFEFTAFPKPRQLVKKKKAVGEVASYRQYPFQPVVLLYDIPPFGFDLEAVEAVVDSFPDARRIYLVITRGMALIDEAGNYYDEDGRNIYDLALSHDGVILPLDCSPEAVNNYYTEVFEAFARERELDTTGFDTKSFVSQVLHGDYPSKHLKEILNRIKSNGCENVDTAYEVVGKKKPAKEGFAETTRMVCLDEIDEKIDTFLNLVQYSKKRIQKGLKPVCSNTVIMMGPSGVGKTETAKKLASWAYQRGILPSAEPMIISAADLIGEYLGQTSPLVRNTFQAAVGKVLFIDEAYSLAGTCSNGHLSLYSKDAIAQLLIELDRVNATGDTIVVLAGYEKEMDVFLSSNPGLRSRLSSCVLNFKAYDKVQVTDVFYTIAEREGFDTATIREDVVRGEIEAYFEGIIASPDYANGRSARNLFEVVISELAMRLSESGEEDDTITAEDITKAIKRISDMKTSGFKQKISLV